MNSKLALIALIGFEQLCPGGIRRLADYSFYLFMFQLIICFFSTIIVIID